MTTPEHESGYPRMRNLFEEGGLVGPQDPHVAALAEVLIDAGAVQVDRAFATAGPDQAELISGGKRLLLTPNDEAYQKYATVMRRAELTYAADTNIDPGVVVAEIPRDSRTLPQVMRSKQPLGGRIIRDVFETVGTSIDQMMRAAQVSPDLGQLSLQRILIVRSENELIFMPPLSFVPVQENTKAALVGHMSSILLPEFSRFNGLSLLAAFERGLRHGSPR